MYCVNWQFSSLLFSSACHSSCASCWGPSVSQCTLCPSKLLLHQGQCVEACGEGLYSLDNTCHSKWLNFNQLNDASSPFCCLKIFCPFDLLSPLSSDCHPSCRSCGGPLASDCLLCLKPEELLLPQSSHLHHGVCTAGCPTRTFLDDKQTCKGEYRMFLVWFPPMFRRSSTCKVELVLLLLLVTVIKGDFGDFLIVSYGSNVVSTCIWTVLNMSLPSVC